LVGKPEPNVVSINQPRTNEGFSVLERYHCSLLHHQLGANALPLGNGHQLVHPGLPTRHVEREALVAQGVAVHGRAAGVGHHHGDPMPLCPLKGDGGGGVGGVGGNAKGHTHLLSLAQQLELWVNLVRLLPPLAVHGGGAAMLPYAPSAGVAAPVGYAECCVGRRRGLHLKGFLVGDPSPAVGTRDAPLPLEDGRPRGLVGGEGEELAGANGVGVPVMPAWVVVVVLAGEEEPMGIGHTHPHIVAG